MHYYDFSNLDKKVFTTNIFNLVASIREYKGKQELFIDSKPDILNAMLEVAKIQSVGASNRIEGIYTSDKRLEEIVTHKAEPKNRSEQEIAGYREVLKTIHENYDYMKVSPNLILQLHRDLYSYYPAGNTGRWKNGDNVIAEQDSKGNEKIRFQPTTAFETPAAMNDLCQNFNKALDKAEYDPLILIPMFILDFLCIHPFNDGNGRMSRLLTLLLLYRKGYIVGKYISLEMIIENSKESYYDALQSSSFGWHDNANDYVPFIEYYLSIVFKAHQNFSSRVEHLSNLKISKPERIKKIFDRSLKKLTKADIISICPDISISTVEQTLRGLSKEGYITKLSSGRYTSYIKNNN